MEQEGHKLHTEKRIHYIIWRDLILKYQNKKMTKSDVMEIVEHAYNMNKGGRGRQISYAVKRNI